jgi:hypothetical protein
MMVDRAGNQQLATAAYGLVHSGDHTGRRPLACHDDYQIEGTHPAGKAMSWPCHEWHRTDRFEHCPDEASLGACRDHRTRTRQPSELIDRLCRVGGLPAHPGAGFGESAQYCIGTCQRLFII